MGIYHLISQRLQLIRHFYNTAAAPFIDHMKRIEAKEAPYDVPPGGFNPEAREPPFLEDWERNNDSLRLLGHAGIAVLQVALRLYLDEYKLELKRLASPTQEQERPSGRTLRSENWFAKYRAEFERNFCIDWAAFGVEQLAILDQITLARDDIFHHPDLWSVNVYQSQNYFERYAEPFFVSDWDRRFYERTGKIFPCQTWTLDVTPDKFNQSVETVDAFCQFMERKWPG